eukprot:4851291-Prymnesium_polylepis.2
MFQSCSAVCTLAIAAVRCVVCVRRACVPRRLRGGTRRLLPAAYVCGVPFCVLQEEGFTA